MESMWQMRYLGHIFTLYFLLKVINTANIKKKKQSYLHVIELVTRFTHGWCILLYDQQVDDLSLRDNATNCLVTMVTQFGVVEYDQGVYREIIAQSLLPEVKKGVRNKEEVQ